MLGANKPTGITYIHPFHFMERTRDNKTQTNAETGVDAIVAGESVFQGVIGEITTEQLAEFAASNTDILIVGTYQYCDEIGTESMHTFEIHSRNALNSVLNFSVVGDTETPWLPYGKKAEIESFSACKPFDDIDPNRQGQKGLIR